MRVLVACEFSATVRDAFLEQGHDAWSCDLEPTTGLPHRHIQGDVIPVLQERWDLVISHPPCDHLAVSGARWFPEKRADGRQQAAIAFFMLFTQLNHVPYVCIENPVGIMSTQYRKPDQIIQPWMFGVPQTKATCLWFKALPKLERVNDLGPPQTPEQKKEWAKVHRMGPSPDRKKNRSLTFIEVAQAMADQWSNLGVI